MLQKVAVVARKSRTALRQPIIVIALVPLVWVMLGLASAAILLLPFKVIAPLLGRNLGATALVPLIAPRTQNRAIRIGHALGIAAKLAPFRSDCLPQALVAAALCRLSRVPYVAQLGASMSDPDKRGKLVAHAWVQSGPIIVSGGTGSFARYGIVACFVSP